MASNLAELTGLQKKYTSLNELLGVRRQCEGTTWGGSQRATCKGMNVGSLCGSVTLDVSRRLRSSLFCDACSSSWVTSLSAGLGQSIPVSSRAVSRAQLTGNQVTWIIPGDPCVVLSFAPSLPPSSLEDHWKASHTGLGTTATGNARAGVPQEPGCSPFSGQPSKRPVVLATIQNSMYKTEKTQQVSQEACDHRTFAHTDGG